MGSETGASSYNHLPYFTEIVDTAPSRGGLRTREAGTNRRCLRGRCFLPRFETWLSGRRPEEGGPCREIIVLTRALCRIKVLPVTQVLVDTWMLTVKPVYKLLNVSDDLKWTTNTHVTPFSLTFKA